MRNPGPAFLLLAATLAAACADDEATWPAVRTDMGWLATSPEGTAERFCPDGGDTLDVAGRMGGLRPDTTYRVMATHTAAPGPTTLTRVEMALVAAPRTYAHEKTDPVEAVSTWAGGGCINLRLAVRTRNEGTHYFGCIDRGVTRWPDGRQTLRLGLYHARAATRRRSRGHSTSRSTSPPTPPAFAPATRCASSSPRSTPAPSRARSSGPRADCRPHAQSAEHPPRPPGDVPRFSFRSQAGWPFFLSQ